MTTTRTAADPFDAAADPEKLRQEAHKAATSIAKSINDCYWKVDDALNNIPESAPAKAQLKAIRDSLFVQKQQAESIVQSATATQQDAAAPAPGTAPAPGQTPVAPPADPMSTGPKVSRLLLPKPRK
jgi:hypothetical protein